MKPSSSDMTLDQIEYLLHQSTQGIHFMFEKTDIVRVLSQPTDDEEFFTFTTMGRVQEILTRFIEKPTLIEKKHYLELLPREEHELLIRAYFNLVENTILANSELKH